jgi:hypothetical protein
LTRFLGQKCFSLAMLGAASDTTSEKVSNLATQQPWTRCSADLFHIQFAQFGIGAVVV